MVLGNPLQGDLCLPDGPVQLIPLLSLLCSQRILEVPAGNIETGTGARGSDLLRGQGTVIETRLVRFGAKVVKPKYDFACEG